MNTYFKLLLGALCLGLMPSVQALHFGRTQPTTARQPYHRLSQQEKIDLAKARIDATRRNLAILAAAGVTASSTNPQDKLLYAMTASSLKNRETRLAKLQKPGLLERFGFSKGRTGATAQAKRRTASAQARTTTKTSTRSRTTAKKTTPVQRQAAKRTTTAKRTVAAA